MAQSLDLRQVFIEAANDHEAQKRSKIIVDSAESEARSLINQLDQELAKQRRMERRQPKKREK